MKQSTSYIGAASHKAIMLLTFGAVVIGTSGRCMAQASSEDKTQQVDERMRALAAAYVANRDSFQQIECTFELRKFRPENEEDVFSGRAQPEAVARGTLLRDDGKMKQEIAVPDVEVKAALERGWIVFGPKCLLLGGERGISYSKDINGGVIYSSSHPAKNTLLGPFSFGLFFSGGGPQPETILEGPDAQFTVRRVEGAVADEPHAAVPMRELVGFEYVTKPEIGSLRIQFFIAPKQGHIPIVCKQIFEEQLIQKTVTTDIREFDQQRVFPMRNLNVHYNPSKPNLVAAVVESRVTDIKVGKPVDPALFQIKVKANAALRDAADDKSQFVVPQARTISLGDLNELFQTAAKQSTEQVAIEKEIAARGPGPLRRPGAYSRVILWIVNLLLIVFLGATLVVMRSRKKKAAAGQGPPAGKTG